MIAALKKYGTIKGRASRSEYWSFTLLAGILLTVVFFINENVGGLLTLGLIIPIITVRSRRLHDLNKSGWWQLLSIIPVAEVFFLIYFCFKGTDGDNRFGADPLQQSPSKDDA